jgi:hypothetical protein
MAILIMSRHLVKIMVFLGTFGLIFNCWACCDKKGQCSSIMIRVNCPNHPPNVKATILKCVGDHKNCVCQASDPCIRNY